MGSHGGRWQGRKIVCVHPSSCGAEVRGASCREGSKGEDDLGEAIWTSWSPYQHSFSYEMALTFTAILSCLQRPGMFDCDTVTELFRVDY